MNIQAKKINEKGAIKRFAKNAILQIQINPLPFVILLIITMICSFLLQLLPFGKNTIQAFVEIFLFIFLAEISYSNSSRTYSFKSWKNSLLLVLDFYKKLLSFRLLSISIIIVISIIFDLFSLGTSDIKSSEMMKDPNFNGLLTLSSTYSSFMMLFSVYFHSFALFVLFFQKAIVTDDYYNYRQQGGLYTDEIIVKNPSNEINNYLIMKLRYPFLFISIIISAIPIFGMLMSFIVILMMMQYTYESYGYENLNKNIKKNNKLVKM